MAPSEVEGCLTEHPAVLEAGVIGREDAEGLTKPHAFVVLEDGFVPSEALGDELRRHVRERLAGYKVPHWMELVPELPKTSTGKIQRFQLRRQQLKH
ncbi:MAG: hypothetical protein ACE5JD_09735 [Candidatus Methylomirabilia bacterium]